MRSHSATPLVVSSLLSPPGEGTCILMINDHCLIRILTEIPILKSPTKKRKIQAHVHTRENSMFSFKIITPQQSPQVTLTRRQKHNHYLNQASQSLKFRYVCYLLLFNFSLSQLILPRRLPSFLLYSTCHSANYILDSLPKANSAQKLVLRINTCFLLESM